MARGQKKEKKELTPEERTQNALVPEEEWPYELPEGWKWVRLGSVCTFIGGGTPSKSNQDYWDGDIPWASVKDIKGDYLDSTQDSITEEGLNNSAANLCEPGDLILITRIEPGKTVVSNIRSAINQDLKIVKSDLDEKYMHYYFQTFFHLFEEKASGSTVKGITIKSVEQMPFPLVSVATQKKIAIFLDQEFQRLDEAKDLLQSVLDSSEERKQSTLHKAFTGELTENWRQRTGHSIEEWKTVKLQDYCEKITCGKTPKDDITQEGEIPYLKVYNIVNDKVDFDSKPQFIPRSVHEGKLSSSRLIPHDVIMNIVGPPLRKIAIVPDDYPEWNMNQAIVRFRPTDKLNYEYLFYALVNPETLDPVIQQTKGVVGQANISVTQSRNLTISLPTVEEQLEIVRTLKQIMNRETDYEESVDEAIDKIEELKKSILSKAFHGELFA